MVYIYYLMFIKHGWSLLKKPLFFLWRAAQLTVFHHVNIFTSCAYVDVQQRTRQRVGTRLQPCSSATTWKPWLQTWAVYIALVHSSADGHTPRPGLLNRWMWTVTAKLYPVSMTLGTDVVNCLYTLFFFAQETEKNENWAMQLWIMRTFLFICQRSRQQLARGYNVPLNSHYEFKSNLHHMDLQMWLQLELIVRLIQKDLFIYFLPFCCSLPQSLFYLYTLLWNQL